MNMGWLCWNIGYIGSRKDLDKMFREEKIAECVCVCNLFLSVIYIYLCEC